MIQITQQTAKQKLVKKNMLFLTFNNGIFQTFDFGKI